MSHIIVATATTYNKGERVAQHVNEFEATGSGEDAAQMIFSMMDHTHTSIFQNEIRIFAPTTGNVTYFVYEIKN